MPRLIRVITSFAAVLGAYWLYALLAVPLIEPAAAGPQKDSGGEGRRGAAGRIDSRLGELRDLVPPEARAQLETPWIIESDDFKVLMQSYSNRDDGRVKVEPCLLIYTPGASKPDAKPKPPIVLYAPAGAVMVFDRRLDLRGGDVVGHPTSGRLLGEITITSPGQSDGPEDDLRIVTRDVQLTPERISTTNPVSFRYGASFGSGRNLVIKLLREKQRPGSSDAPPEIQGIEWFELRNLEHLHLELPEKSPSAETVQTREAPARLDTKRPLEITCQGPFRFDPVRQYAKFQNQVDVLQLNPEGPADQLNCELLTLYFSRSRKQLVDLDGKQDAPEALDMNDADLELREIEATGNPVIVRAFSRDAEVRGERLSYDVQQECVVLEGSNEVLLREKASEIHARRVQYKSKGKERLGEIFAQGPGWMRGEMANRPGQEVFVSWGDQLQLEPFENQHLATLSGGVELKYSGVGTLNAARIDFWLFELPAGPGREKLEVVPDRMLVQDHVRLNSPQAYGNFDQLKIWFERVADSPGTSSATVPGGSAATAGPSPNPLAGTLQPRAANEPLERRFQVRGDLAQARFLIRDKKNAELAELMLDGSVQLDEIPLVPSTDQPMHLEGDRIQVLEAHDTAKTSISVIGRLAVFRGRAMALSGTNINVDAATNRLWIDGSGEMELPMDRDLKGNPLPSPGVLAITWQKEMDFDGRRALFQEKVLARGMGHQLQTETLEAVFQEPIEFRTLQSKSRPRPELEQVVCRGGVFMEGQTYEPVLPPQADGNGFLQRAGTPAGVDPRAAQALASWEQFQALELMINRLTGELYARGPGQITTIRPKSQALFEKRQSQGLPPAGTVAGGGQLTCLHVQFRQMMTGNTMQRVATFHEVRCAYDAVDSWQARLDVHDPDALGDKTGILLTADRVTVAESPASAAGDGSIELEAADNVIAENRIFTARANRMSYSEAKEWLILEGNGYAPAELTFQQYELGPPTPFSAEKIYYWPRTKEVKIDNGHSLQMNALPLP